MLSRHMFERALLGLHPAPVASPWNLEQLADLLPAEPLRPAAVLVGLREHGSGTTVLLTRRQDALRHHAGQISFPGGRVDLADAGPLAAAIRETEEEVGLPARSIEPLGWLDPYATITGFHVYPLVARIDHDDDAGALLQTSVSGALEPISPAVMRRAFWRQPLLTLAVIARIHWQAVRLFAKRVPFVSKPTPPERFVTR
jgi:8-oxo-dGTP pyrophosphatase MutT (NUDIX family)